MKIKQRLFLSGILLISFYACQNDHRDRKTEMPSIPKVNSGITITKSVKQAIGSGSDEIIRINSYSNNETFLRIEDANGGLLNSAGENNIDLVPNQPIAKSVSFKLKDSCYTVDFYVQGSTYGSNLSMIVWYGYGKWNIFSLPFERFEIKKIPGSNLSEIENFDEKPSKKYLFSGGALIEK